MRKATPNQFETSVLNDLREIRRMIEEFRRDSDAYSEQADTIINRVRKLERLVRNHRHKI